MLGTGACHLRQRGAVALLLSPQVPCVWTPAPAGGGQLAGEHRTWVQDVLCQAGSFSVVKCAKM